MSSSRDGQSEPQRSGTRTFLIIESEPISWAIPANHVLTMGLGEFQNAAPMDLDAILGVTSGSTTNERTVVLQTPRHIYALRTKCHIRLAVVDSTASSPIPAIVFGGNLERALTRQLLFADDGRATLVLAVDALTHFASPNDMINTAARECGEPLP